MKKISVIIPYYKKKQLIKRTVLSVLKQSHKLFEIIIIYDDSDVSDLNYIKKIKKLDRRIKLIVNKKNVGAGFSRNLGIKKSSGDYIAFLDADDYWKKNKLEKQLNFMLRNKYLISHTSYEIQNTSNKKLGSRFAKNYYNFEKLLVSCDIGLSSVMIKKGVLKGNLIFPNIKTKEDFVLWLLILKKGISIYALKSKLVFWTKTENSLSSSTIQKLKDSYLVYSRYMKFNVFKTLMYIFILSFNYIKKSFLKFN